LRDLDLEMRKKTDRFSSRVSLWDYEEHQGIWGIKSDIMRVKVFRYRAIVMSRRTDRP